MTTTDELRSLLRDASDCIDGEFGTTKYTPQLVKEITDMLTLLDSCVICDREPVAHYGKHEIMGMYVFRWLQRHETECTLYREKLP